MLSRVSALLMGVLFLSGVYAADNKDPNQYKPESKLVALGLFYPQTSENAKVSGDRIVTTNSSICFVASELDCKVAADERDVSLMNYSLDFGFPVTYRNFAVAACRLNAKAVNVNDQSQMSFYLESRGSDRRHWLKENEIENTNAIDRAKFEMNGAKRMLQKYACPSPQ